jgi:hypothetical protein
MISLMNCASRWQGIIDLRMNTTVRSYLIEIARLPSRKTITDQELSTACGLGLEMQDSAYAKEEMIRILTDISKYSQGRELFTEHLF